MTTFQSQLLYALGNKTKVLPELKKVFVRPLIQIAVKAINQEYIEDGILDRISQKYNVPEEIVDEYYSVIFTILKIHLGTLSESVKPIEFKQVLEELRLSSECIDDLSTVVYSQKRPELMSGLIQKTKFYPHLISCKWRIDVTVSSSILNRVLEPHVIMEWTFNNGKRQIFELSLSKFHQLRHAIATILVEMQKVEQQCASKNITCS
ncbi:COMM domain-containing protein 5 [Habropoda laboriosa]|uniref:COMM domain-containing protein 5 n=1 Tax=Habropoda laboriosa TaxID=597456 RepID=A0A0L7R8Q8_9HYME|nr:PREDICTED: COMM domain-containing protein 5-like [Habropoda laboriosa]KOC67213.1 COMM domain-containing protein 5 [Habropoda laboriosa]